jgi:hypothetical protein
MATRVRSPRPSLLLLVLLLCALAVGAAVSLLASARTAGPPPPVGPTTELILPPWAVSLAIIAFGVAMVAPIVYFRLRTPGAGGLAHRLMVSSFALLLALLIAVALLHLGSGGGGFQTVHGGSPGNSTGGTNGTTGGNNTTVPGPGGVLAPFNFGLPSWALFVLAVVVAVLVTVAVIPPLANFLEDRREARSSRRRANNIARDVQSALQAAGRDLATALDPRAIILALYATLLARIEPLVSDLDRSTAEEIRLLHLTRLGIRPQAAEDLTRVFEEARYSSHTMGEAAVARASAAIRAAEEDLARPSSDP